MLPVIGSQVKCPPVSVSLATQYTEQSRE